MPWRSHPKHGKIPAAIQGRSLPTANVHCGGGGDQSWKGAGRCDLARLVFLESSNLILVSASRVRPTSFLGTMVRREQRRSLLEILVQRNGSEDGGDREPQCTKAQNQPVCTRSEETEGDAESKPRTSLRINGGIYLRLLPTQSAPFPPCDLNHSFWRVVL